MLIGRLKGGASPSAAAPPEGTSFARLERSRTRAVVARATRGPRSTRLARLGALVLCLPLASCLNFRYTRIVHLRKPAADFEQLVPGSTGLGESLDTLGAPLIVQEVPQGYALAWGWFEAAEWNLSINAPIGDDSGSVSFASLDGRMRGLLLLFDEQWQLVSIRQGFLRELGQALERKRPRVVNGDSDAGG